MSEAAFLQKMFHVGGMEVPEAAFLEKRAVLQVGRVKRSQKYYVAFVSHWKSATSFILLAVAIMELLSECVPCKRGHVEGNAIVSAQEQICEICNTNIVDGEILTCELSPVPCCFSSLLTH